ncbi:hypothetical protein NDU88_002239 [Pleurodeles waltl]|uniref:Uncharacterized protein n=1 Tax=Pleurodeles waltl TaxID=8319 RepID=A0AAV7NEV3_PLEWA|nr:hypothetical protein NDU88_002239 [Pleurodeles waltl]
MGRGQATKHGRGELLELRAAFGQNRFPEWERGAQCSSQTTWELRGRRDRLGVERTPGDPLRWTRAVTAWARPVDRAARR